SAGLSMHCVDLRDNHVENNRRSEKKSLHKSDRQVKSVRSAVELLSVRQSVGDRIAVVAEKGAADAAVLGSRAFSQVKSFVFLSGRLSSIAKQFLTDWEDDPVLCIASSEDKASLRDMTDIYLSTNHPDTDLHVFEGMGSGERMIEKWASRFPDREPI